MPTVLHSEGKRMNWRELLEVFSNSVERVGQNGLVGGESERVRHLAYAKDTPPKYAILPTPRVLQPTRISAVDARISFSFAKG